MQRFQTSKLLIAGVVLFMSACSKEDSIPVSEFLKNRDLLTKTRGFCMENPAERKNLPNCINSNTAGGMTSGLASAGCFKDGAVIPSCVDEFIKKRGIK